MRTYSNSGKAEESFELRVCRVLYPGIDGGAASSSGSCPIHPCGYRGRPVKMVPELLMLLPGAGEPVSVYIVPC